MASLNATPAANLAIGVSAAAFAAAACARGYRVRFFRVTELVPSLIEARDERALLGLRARLGNWHPTIDVQHAHVVMGLRPVDPDEDHRSSFRLDVDLEPGGVARRPNGSVLVWHDIPPAVGSSPPGGGTI